MGWVVTRHLFLITRPCEDASAALAQPLGRTRVIDVVMGHEHGADRLRRRAERVKRAQELVPVAGVSGIDNDELTLVFDQIEVHPLRAQAIDAGGDLGRPSLLIRSLGHVRSGLDPARARTALMKSANTSPGKSGSAAHWMASRLTAGDHVVRCRVEKP
jgi:hypothetical protein